MGQQIHSGCEANAAPEDAAVHDESTRVSVNEYVSSTNTADFDLPFQGDRLEPGGGPGALQNTDTIRVTELAHKNVAVTKVLLREPHAATQVLTVLPAQRRCGVVVCSKVSCGLTLPSSKLRCSVG